MNKIGIGIATIGLVSALVLLAVSVAPAMAQLTPPTPYVINGYVFYENGSACNGSIVNVTNLNTSAKWEAETNATTNYYELVLANGTDVNVSEVLRFNAKDPDATQFNITDHTVNQTELNDGGVFNFNITLKEPTVTTYNFTTGAGTNKWAYKGHDESKPPATSDVPSTMFVQAEYNNIEANNGSMANYTTPSNANNNYAIHRFKFNVTEPVGSIVKIGVLWNGIGEHENSEQGATLYIWNGTAYEQLMNSSSGSEVDLSGERTENIGNYIDATGNSTILVEQNSPRSQGKNSKICTDYVKVDISYVT